MKHPKKCRIKPFPNGQRNMPLFTAMVYTDRYMYHFYNDGSYGRYKRNKTERKAIKVEKNQAYLCQLNQRFNRTTIDSIDECFKFLNTKQSYNYLRFDLPSVQAYATWLLG